MKTLEAGKEIIVSGIEKNIPIYEKFVGFMLSLALKAYFFHTNSVIHGVMGIVKSTDMVILLMKSGETEKSVYFTGQFKKCNVNIWLLTFSKNSTLVDENLNRIVPNLEYEEDLEYNDNNSTMLDLIVRQGLAMRLAKRMKLELCQFKKNHPSGAIGEFKKEIGK